MPWNPSELYTLVGTLSSEITRLEGLLNRVQAQLMRIDRKQKNLAYIVNLRRQRGKEQCHAFVQRIVQQELGAEISKRMASLLNKRIHKKEATKRFRLRAEAKASGRKPPKVAAKRKAGRKPKKSQAAS